VDGVRAGTRSVRGLRAWRDGRPASHHSSSIIDNTMRCGQVNAAWSGQQTARSHSDEPGSSAREWRLLVFLQEALAQVEYGRGPQPYEDRRLTPGSPPPTSSWVDTQYRRCCPEGRRWRASAPRWTWCTPSLCGSTPEKLSLSPGSEVGLFTQGVVGRSRVSARSVPVHTLAGFVLYVSFSSVVPPNSWSQRTYDVFNSEQKLGGLQPLSF
jgi:hypothetical protein